MSTEHAPIERMEGSDYPFYGKGEPVQVDVTTNLDTLGLHLNSTAAEVRKLAFKLRAEKLGGKVDDEVVESLRWALQKTRDCIDDHEFEAFVRFNWSFEEIRFGRNR